MCKESTIFCSEKGGRETRASLQAANTGLSSCMGVTGQKHAAQYRPCSAFRPTG